MSQDDQNELYHHGIKGMKWGIRHTPSINNLTPEQKKMAIDTAKAGGKLAYSYGSHKIKSVAATTSVKVGKAVVKKLIKEAPTLAMNQITDRVNMIKLGKAVAVNGSITGYGIAKTGFKVAKIGGKGIVLGAKLAAKTLG